jgi:P27 family predicted phage terminase small subunit
MREAHDQMHRVGLVIKDQRKSVKKNPLFMIWKDSLNGYLRLSEEFGLSPKSRSEKIRFSKEKKEIEDEKYFAE